MVKVAISSDFLKAYSMIPVPEQKKVRAFIAKFMEDPTQASINYEKIKIAKDPKVRTVRIGLSYRAIVIHPDLGEVYLLVWVDHHDEAMDWTRDKVFQVNKMTGAIQVFPVGEGTELPPSTQEYQTKRLFASFSDEDLLLVGVPPLLLPSIRDLITDHDLERCKTFLPEEAFDGLFMLASGYSLEDTLEELTSERQPLVNEEDFEKALEHQDSSTRFRVIASKEELEEVLQEPFEKWRLFLHPRQKELAEASLPGSIKVTGGPGTGKTVLALHRARFLAKALVKTEEDQRILLTTFSRSLAESLEQNLKLLCTKKEKERIHVVHLHAYIYDYYTRNIGPVVPASPKQIEENWKKQAGKDWPLGFLLEEWELVVAPKGIDTEEDYLKTPRTGRGTPLVKAKRREFWKRYQAFKEELQAQGVLDWPSIVHRTRLLLAKEDKAPYKAIVVDESQDFGEEEFRVLRLLVKPGPNDLFLVGDSHQRIYGNPLRLSHAGIHCRGERQRSLNLNYRTTREISNWSLGVLGAGFFDDSDFELDESKIRSAIAGPPPVIEHFKRSEEEKEALCKQLLSWLMEGVNPKSICLLARTRRALEEEYKEALEEAGLLCCLLEDVKGDEGKGIRLATMHRAKGLEFSKVVIAGLNEDVLPLKRAFLHCVDEASRKRVLEKERALLYVAATRARDTLWVTSFGKQSPLLKKMQE